MYICSNANTHLALFMAKRVKQKVYIGLSFKTTITIMFYTRKCKTDLHIQQTATTVMYECL